jgi:hypothetical protein
MTLAAQVFDHRAAARGIFFDISEEQEVGQYSYHRESPFSGEYIINLVVGAYHPIVFAPCRGLYIGRARISHDWSAE